MPFVAQAPMAPVRLTSNMTVMPPPAPSVAPPPEKITSQPVTAPCPKEDCPQQQMLDLCKKLNERLNHMERCLQDRKLTPPANCPPSQPLLPQLFRRPLFNRCEPTICEPANCEPVFAPGQPVQVSEPIATPTRTPITITNTLPPAPQPVQPAQPIESLGAPARTSNGNTDPNLNMNTPLTIPQSLPVDPRAPMLPNE